MNPADVHSVNNLMKLSISDQLVFTPSLTQLIHVSENKAGNGHALTMDYKSPLRLRAVRVSSRNKCGLLC
jgi:hypothetical protein